MHGLPNIKIYYCGFPSSVRPVLSSKFFMFVCHNIVLWVPVLLHTHSASCRQATYLRACACVCVCGEGGVGFLVSFDGLIFSFFSYNFFLTHFPLTKPDAKLLKVTVAVQRLRIALSINWNEQHFPTFPPEAKQMQFLKHCLVFRTKYRGQE